MRLMSEEYEYHFSRWDLFWYNQFVAIAPLHFETVRYWKTVFFEIQMFRKLKKALQNFGMDDICHISVGKSEIINI